MLLVALLLVAFLVSGASLPEIAGLLALGLVLVAVEALNTAIEVLVDHLSPGWSQFSRDAKDLGSLAVACTIGALVLYSGAVLIG
jgi:diacylglycerol kinase (ATP)